MLTRLLATTAAFAIGIAVASHAEDTKASKQGGDYAQIKTVEDVAKKLNMLNQKEIECGELGQRKSENAEVKEYARMVEADHRRANEQVQEFAKTNSINLNSAIHAHDEHVHHNSRPGDAVGVKTPVTQGTAGNVRVGDRESSTETRSDSDSNSDANSDARNEKKGEKRAEREKMQRLESLSGEEFDREYTTMMAQAHEKSIRQLSAAKDNVEDAAAKELIASMLPDLQTHKDQATALSRKFGGNPDTKQKTDARSDR